MSYAVAIVIDGALEPNGVVSFRKVLKPQDAAGRRPREQVLLTQPHA